MAAVPNFPTVNVTETKKRPAPRAEAKARVGKAIEGAKSAISSIEKSVSHEVGELKNYLEALVTEINALTKENVKLRSENRMLKDKCSETRSSRLKRGC